MPDNFERIIYKLEVDGDGIIRGTEAMTASISRFTQEQERANNTLKTNEAALKINTDRLNKARADLEAYTGTNARYRKQLEGDVKSAEKDQAKLTELVNTNRVAYENATKAAQDFANTTTKAAQLSQGGKIPTPTIVQPAIPQVGNIQQALSGISLGDLPESLNRVLPEFEQLRGTIEQAKIRMSELNQEDEEFKQLAPIVAQGEDALRLYDEAVKTTDSSHKSLRTQLREGREELVRLEQQGKSTSKEYIELEKNVAKLTDEFGDQQERIRVLASDTRLLNFGKSAIQAATAAFQTYASVQILVGEENEELQKKTMQLFAAMQLLTSLETLSNAVKRGSVIATEAQTAATSIYTAVVGASTGALKAFRLALLATGIGAAVVAIGLLIYKYNQMKEAAAKAAAETKLLNDVRTKAIEGYAKEVSQLEVLRIKLTTLSTPQNERIRLAKEYNKTADETAKIDLKQIDNINLLNSAIDRQIVKIKERALAQAAANVTEEAATELFKAQQKVVEIAPKFQLNLPEIDRQIKNVQDQIDNLSFKEWTKENVALTKHLQELRSALVDVRSANEDFNRSARLTATLPTTTPEKPTPTPKTAGQREIENVFEQERQKQKERLAELLRKSVEDEKTIRAEFEQQLITEKQRIDNLLKDKKLTKPQAETLKIEAAKINTTELDKALEDFRKKVADAREKLNDELRDLQNKAIQDSLNLLNDEFQRRAALIDLNEKEEIENAKEALDDRLKALDFDKLLIGEEEYQRLRALTVANGEQAILNIEGRAARERQNLSADIFKRSLEVTEQILDEQLTQLDEQTAEKIRAQKRLLDLGQINFDQFQKALTKIQKDEKAKRDKLRLDELKAELDAINARLQATQSPEEKDQLQTRQRSVRKEIADIESKVETDDPNEKKKESLQNYVESIGQLTDAVIQFWAKANEAEQKALDRSIELQQRRVDAAQRITERGNAAYLKEEEDRLRELEVKRENAARKQLGIDAALQASQILVAITGAIAKIANPVPGAGIAETIAAIAVIVGSLATGYGLVKSLQGNQPKLAEGTTYVSHPTAPKGKDKIPAWLDEGEAVFPAETNRDYKPSVEAIYHGKVPPKVMNEFVQNYVTNKSDNVHKFASTVHKVERAPEVNIERIKETNEKHISHDTKLAGMLSEQNKLLRENNEYQRQLLRKQIKVENNFDRNGIATAVTEYITERELDKLK